MDCNQGIECSTLDAGSVYLFPQKADYDVAPELGQTTPPGYVSAQSMVSTYLGSVEEYCRLQAIRAKGWANPEGDQYFQRQRQNADNAGANKKTALAFFHMMKKIAAQVDDATGIFQLPHLQPTVLDTCVAPGGFVSYILDNYPRVEVTGFSLPVEAGGHKLFLGRNQIRVNYTDVTMLAADMGATEDEIPAEHPEKSSFRLQRVLQEEERFDLVICDGQVLRTHQRPKYREPYECRRLSVSQLVLGLEHVKSGGSMIVLMHKLEQWGTVRLLQIFSTFAEISLFKSTKFHAIRSSFYLVAKNIQPNAPAAVEAIKAWKHDWLVSTLGNADEFKLMVNASAEDVQVVLDKFGEKLVSMGRSIWDIQAEALEQKSWTR